VNNFKKLFLFVIFFSFLEFFSKKINSERSKLSRFEIQEEEEERKF